MSREFRALCEADRAGTPAVLDRYGATNPAEFFAVATRRFSNVRAPFAPGIQNCTLNLPISSGRIPFAILLNVIQLDTNESKCLNSTMKLHLPLAKVILR